MVAEYIAVVVAVHYCTVAGGYTDYVVAWGGVAVVHCGKFAERFEDKAAWGVVAGWAVAVHYCNFQQGVY